MLLAPAGRELGQFRRPVENRGTLVIYYLLHRKASLIALMGHRGLVYGVVVTEDGVSLV